MLTGQIRIGERPADLGGPLSALVDADRRREQHRGVVSGILNVEEKIPGRFRRVSDINQDKRPSLPQEGNGESPDYFVEPCPTASSLTMYRHMVAS